MSEARARLRLPLAGRERAATWAMAVAFLAIACAAALTASDRSPSLLVVGGLVLFYALLARLEFEVGNGAALPTQLALVPMLFTLAPGTVPLLVALGLLVGYLPDFARRRMHPERAVVLVGSAWHAVGPALVVFAAGEPQARLSAWWVLVAALAAQFACDFGASATREWLAFRVPLRALLQPLAWVFLVDALLAPIAFLAALASSAWLGSFIFTLPLVILLFVFAHERRRRIDNAIELSNAYRGTALLLGDVIEADDAYTGSHSRDVVALTLAVADDLGLDARMRRKAEFAALLHDVGKIRIPSEIINKPGPLTPEEWDVIRRHTLDGEQMLNQIGGVVGEVGGIVRSCHERYDGAGYPDGLRGEEIPLIARVVACCDAFNAMTTERPYRPALTVANAVAELRDNAGTQFDPSVVESFLRVLGPLRPHDAQPLKREPAPVVQVA